MAWQEIHDDSDLKRYRTELPNMCDDEMDPYQYRLYAHYKRVCGAGNGGACWEEVRTTAAKTKMSAGKVVTTRNWLVANGWITAIQSIEGGPYTIRIIDRWLENFGRYAPPVHQVNAVDKSPAGRAETAQQMDLPFTTRTACSWDEQERSPGEQRVHLVNVRSNVVKKEPEEERTKEENDRLDARARVHEGGVDKSGESVKDNSNGNDSRPNGVRNAESLATAAPPLSPYPLPPNPDLLTVLVAWNDTLEAPFDDPDLADMAVAAAQRHHMSPKQLETLIRLSTQRADNPPGFVFDSLVKRDGRAPRPRPGRTARAAVTRPNSPHARWNAELDEQRRTEALLIEAHQSGQCDPRSCAYCLLLEEPEEEPDGNAC